MEILARDIAQFSKDIDPHEYNDTVENETEYIKQIEMDLQNGNTSHLTNWLEEIITEDNLEEDITKAKELLKRINAL